MPEPVNASPVNDSGSLNSIQRALLEGEVIESLRQVYDPELPVNIYDLGLIYGISVDHLGGVDVTMTLTSPACPVAGTLPGEAESAVLSTPGVTRAAVELVWDPPYTVDRMPEHIRLELGLF
jgi:FeS assembly SUF system protein